jgi:cytochrome c oxidase subunit 2
MWSGFPLFPEQASSNAARVDGLYFFLIALTAFFSLLIGLMVLGFAVRYRRRSPDDRPPAIYGSLVLELTWTIIPLGIVAVVFFWSADLYLSLNRVPKDAIEVHVVGKRWMWKVQHMTGQREINELHVPVGVPVKVTLTSEDVIHSFFIPAFRVKKDALPARYTTMWFQATKPGRYHLFCAEYCGTRHSNMIGWVEVMEPAAFQTWLAGGVSGGSLASAGEKLFQELACVTCHRGDSGQRGPALDGLFGSQVTLADGGTATADETYIRESIVTPSAKVVAGYQPIMPTFQGLVSEEQLLQLVAYVRTLKVKSPAPGPAPDVPVAAPAPGAHR